MPSREAIDAEEAKALADIEEYGCHILYVLEEDEHPPFAYSVGIEHNFGVPELVVIGLKPDLSLTIINEYCRRVRGGERFSVGARASGFLEEASIVSSVRSIPITTRNISVGTYGSTTGRISGSCSLSFRQLPGFGRGMSRLMNGFANGSRCSILRRHN
ncbi:DUF4262 domain-containing protein [Mesorhizobium sp. B2-8-3]|uniref:DUF4262 domain-containing protein n=1 Tax=Mesorhizobium sp. B2-8-3 TaxID=2589905 RepID=UPI001FEDA2B7|nr:DUF4262 domain-containing protein [Mesorhizobium sp. B2-8-3]